MMQDFAIQGMNDFAISDITIQNNSHPTPLENVNADRPQKAQEDSSVLSVSEQGDRFERGTVLLDTENGTVSQTRKEDAVRSEAVDFSVKEDKPMPKITSVVGYTASQLKMLYLEGRISRQKYEQTIEARKELAGQDSSSEDSNKDANKIDITAMINNMDSLVSAWEQEKMSKVSGNNDNILGMQIMDALNAWNKGA